MQCAECRTWTRRDLLEVVTAAIALGVLATWTHRLTRLGRSVVSYGSYWSQSQGVPGGLTYVALGDSAAQGIGASSPDRGYVSLLSQRMRELSGGEVLLINLSASGATVRNVVDVQLPKLRALRPDVVTVAIGGNDMAWYDAERFARAADELIDALPAGAVVADVPLSTKARARGLDVVLLHDAERARGSRAMLTDFAADWFHPNDRGHRVWADAFWDVLQHDPALQRQPPSPIPPRSAPPSCR